MVNKHNDIESEIKITNDEYNEENETIELADTEVRAEDKLKQLRQKLHDCEEQKRTLREETSRVQADFLNARKRLEEDMVRDRERQLERHIEALLPLCDSFTMAFSSSSWQAADPAWKTGIEGINNQLLQLLRQYQVEVVDPKGATFDPHEHEAVGHVVVEAEKIDTIVSVMQPGYIRTTKDQRIVIRPARVIIGSTSA
jgi:molecular chaperone GrpE